MNHNNTRIWVSSDTEQILIEAEVAQLNLFEVLMNCYESDEPEWVCTNHKRVVVETESQKVLM